MEEDQNLSYVVQSFRRELELERQKTDDSLKGFSVQERK